jgi:hypothetical protein
LAENSTQFQSLVKGYNYTFNSVYAALGPSPQGGLGLREYGVVFNLYKGPVVIGFAVLSVDVFIDPTLTKVFDATSYPANMNMAIDQPCTQQFQNFHLIFQFYLLALRL